MLRRLPKHVNVSSSAFDPNRCYVELLGCATNRLHLVVLRPAQLDQLSELNASRLAGVARLFFDLGQRRAACCAKIVEKLVVALR